MPYQYSDALVDCKPAYGVNVASITAATTYDNVQQTMAEVDRLGYGTLQVGIHYLTTLAVNKTLKYSMVIHDSDTSGSGFALFKAVTTDTTILTGLQTAATGAVFQNVDLSGAKRYVKALVSTDLSASGTDTVQLYLGYNLGGSETLPVS